VYFAVSGCQMPIIFHCPKCGRGIRVRLIAAGRRGHGLDCGEEIVVPDFNPNGPRRSAPTNPAVESKRKPEILESSADRPTLEFGFRDGGNEQRETTRR
jgi:hypothetical protein